MLELIPVTFKQANEYVKSVHRHHKPVVGHKFSVAVAEEGELCGVAIIGRSVARNLDDGTTLEVNLGKTSMLNLLKTLLICTSLLGGSSSLALAETPEEWDALGSAYAEKWGDSLYIVMEIVDCDGGMMWQLGGKLENWVVAQHGLATKPWHWFIVYDLDELNTVMQTWFVAKEWALLPRAEEECPVELEV